MLIDFNKSREITLPGMNNGTGTMSAKCIWTNKEKL